MENAHVDDGTTVMTGGRRRVLTLAATLALGGTLRRVVSPPGARAGKRKRAYQCAAPLETTSSFVGNQRLAHRFTPTRSGSLRQIQILIDKAPNSTSGDWVVQLVKVTGSPNGTPSASPLDVLAAVTIPDATVPNGFSTLTAKFAGTRVEQGSSPLEVKEYAAVISRPGSTIFGVGTWLDPEGDTCPGQMYQANGDGAFAPLPTLDMVVTVLVV